MLGLPKSTELNKQLPKNAIYAKFQMSNAEKGKVDADISKILIVNEVSAAKINIAEGENVKSFFVLAVILKKKEFDEKTIITISKLIPQNMVLVLEYGTQAKLAVYHTKLMQTEWQEQDRLSLELKGLDMDAVWENVLRSIEGGEWKYELSLDENLALREQQQKLEKEIARLEKLARSEKQPKKKFELVQKANVLKKQLTEL